MLIKTVKILVLFHQMCLSSCLKPLEFPTTFGINRRVCPWSCLSSSPPLHKSLSASGVTRFIHQFGRQPWTGPLVWEKAVMLSPTCLVHLSGNSWHFMKSLWRVKGCLSVKHRGLKWTRCFKQSWATLACPNGRGAVGSHVFAQTSALSWEPSALGRGWHLVWPVSPTEALCFLLGCALHSAGVSSSRGASAGSVGPLPLESAAVQSSQLTARTWVTIQRVGVGCNGQHCKAEGMENRDSCARLLSPPVAALPSVQYTLQSPSSSSWMQPGVCRVRGD